MGDTRYKELERVLIEERKNMHAMENQVREAARKEEMLQTEVERYRLRVESKSFEFLFHFFLPIIGL